MEVTLSWPQGLVVLGLILDIFGAGFVGYEVLNRYKGQLVEQSQQLEDIDYSKPVMTKSYLEWERKKHKVMSFGLVFLLLGFSLQIAGTLWK